MGWELLTSGLVTEPRSGLFDGVSDSLFFDPSRGRSLSFISISRKIGLPPPRFSKLLTSDPAGREEERVRVDFRGCKPEFWAPISLGFRTGESRAHPGEAESLCQLYVFEGSRSAEQRENLSTSGLESLGCGEMAPHVSVKTNSKERAGSLRAHPEPDRTPGPLVNRSENRGGRNRFLVSSGKIWPPTLRFELLAGK